MQGKLPPFAKDLILLGGGHAHALVVRRWAMRPWQGVRLSLVSEGSYAPYSGMLPGLLAGDYSFTEAHIDLRRLCTYAGVRFIEAKATGLDLAEQRIHLAARPSLHFDLLSLNIGSTPLLPPQLHLPAAAVVPVKPVAGLLARLPEMEALAKRRGSQGLRLCVIGGGVGGVELSLALRQRFTAMQAVLHLSLIEQSSQLLPQMNQKAQRILQQRLQAAQVHLCLGQAVSSLNDRQAVLSGGGVVAADYFLVVTTARPPSWIKESGLAVDEHGFVLVGASLQSTSHRQVFAAGDIAHLEEHPCPKAGVFAVRQAKPLGRNLQRQLAGQSLRSYRPQLDFLSLVRTGAGEAVAVRGLLAGRSAWLGRCKQFIDRRFMRRFADLPARQPTASLTPSSASLVGLAGEVKSLEAQALLRCRGCAAKWSGSLLSRVLGRIRREGRLGRQGEAAGYLQQGEGDDASLCSLPPHKALAQTIDYMPALVGDPFLFGRILVNHCFGDIIAMGGRPHSAQLLAVLPLGAESVASEDAYQLIQGVLMQMQVLGGASLLGGHTAEGSELAAGLCCNGFVEAAEVWRKGGLVRGDALLLTRGLGVGVLFAAEMRLAANAASLDTAIASMLQTQHHLKDLLQGFAIHACTDITGFGLLGHSFEMADASQLSVQLNINSVPCLPGAMAAWRQGFRSSLHHSNLAYLQHAHGHALEEGLIKDEHLAMLADPQTAGPLLFSLPWREAEEAVDRLRRAGFKDASIIGRVEERGPMPMRLTLGGG